MEQSVRDTMRAALLNFIWAGKKGGSEFSDAMHNFYRRWFIQGQSDYRAGNPMPEEALLNEHSEAGWHMGWNADAAVEARGLRLSNLGIFRPKPVSLEYLDDEPQDMSEMQGKGNNPKADKDGA